MEVYNLNKYKSKVKVHYVYGGENNGDCIVLEIKDNNIIIDFGVETDGSELISYLTEHNISKFKYAIITHYHSDHIGNLTGLEAVVNNENLDFSDCEFILPPQLDYTQFNGSYTVIQTFENAIKTFLELKNIEFKSPVDKEEIVIDKDTIIRFLNCNENYYNDYYDITINDMGIEQNATEYNNFSIVTELISNDIHFLFTGDIESGAESKIYSDIEKCNVLKVQHHGVNGICNDDWKKNIIPQYAVIMNTGITFNDRGTYKYLDNNNVIIYTSNDSENIVINTEDGLIKIESTNEPYNINNNSFIETNSDLNDYQKEGAYYGASCTNIDNFPSGFSCDFKLNVINMNEIRCYQTLITNTTVPHIFIRNISGDGWSSWKDITTTSKPYLRANLNSDFTLSSSIFETLPLQTAIQQFGDDFEIVNNSINVKNSGRVEISAMVTFETGIAVGDRIMVGIFKNATLLYRMDTTANNVYQGISLPSFQTNVVENDKITLQVRNVTSTSGKIISSYYGTFLSVESK